MQTFMDIGRDVEVAVYDEDVVIRFKGQAFRMTPEEFDALYAQAQRAHHEAVNP